MSRDAERLNSLLLAGLRPDAVQLRPGDARTRRVAADTRAALNPVPTGLCHRTASPGTMMR